MASFGTMTNAVGQDVPTGSASSPSSAVKVSEWLKISICIIAIVLFIVPSYSCLMGRFDNTSENAVLLRFAPCVAAFFIFMLWEVIPYLHLALHHFNAPTVLMFTSLLTGIAFVAVSVWIGDEKKSANCFQIGTSLIGYAFGMVTAQRLGHKAPDSGDNSNFAHSS